MTANLGATPEGSVIGGRYRVLKTLGRGGFGVVYLVTANHDGRQYALKTFLKGIADKRATARFKQEAEIWIALGSHPNLVQAYFVDEIDGRLYVGMEFIQPGNNGLNSLDGYLQHQPPDLVQTLKWGIQLCHGMEYAAARGVRSHRDLKPPNVMIDPQGRAKVSDFGLASHPGEQVDLRSDLTEGLDPTGFHGQTVRGMGFGTPTHMPPEQFQDAGASDERTDVYATGVMLYQMVTGTLPITIQWPRENSLEARLRAWREMEAAHRSFVLPRMDHPIEPVLRRCIASDPEDRYPSFANLRVDLEPLLRNVAGITIPPPERREVTPAHWVNRGISLQRLSRFKEALVAFDTALSSNSKLVAAWNGRGVCLAKMGRYQEAYDAYGTVLKLEPGNARAHANRGNCLRAAGRPEDALSSFDTALGMDPGLAGTWSNRGNLLFEMERSADALDSYNRALEIQPGKSGTLSNRGRVLLALGRHDEALASFEAALESNERFVPSLAGRAAALVHLGRYAAAIACYARLESLDGMTPEAWLGMGLARAYSEEYQKALLAFARAAEAPRVRARALTASAMVQFQLHRFGPGLEALREAFAFADPDRVARHLEAVLLHALARYDEALDGWHGLLASAGPHPSIAAGLSCTLFHLGRDRQASDVLTEALGSAGNADQEDTAALRYNLGVAFALQGRWPDARRAFDIAIELEPYWTDAWHNRGVSLLEEGNHAEALRAFNGAFQYDRHHTAYWSGDTRPRPDHPRRVPDLLFALDAATTLRKMQTPLAPLSRVPFLRAPVLLVGRYVPSLASD